MNHSVIRKSILLLVLTLSTTTVKAQLKSIVFTPQWHANIQFAGYIRNCCYNKFLTACSKSFIDCERPTMLLPRSMRKNSGTVCTL